MSALTDLKKLVMEGMLEKDVDIIVKGKKFTFTLSTVTWLDELKVMDAAGLEAAPQGEVKTMKYILALLPYAIKKINGEPVVHDQVKDTVGIMDGPLIGELYGAYVALHTTEIKAGEELKNS